MTSLNLHLYYKFFFFYLEPLSALAGFLAALNPALYLRMLNASSPKVQDATVTASVYQLANLYLFFALTEALVFRAARHHLPVQRALATAMLVADLGHLAAVAPLGAMQYWDVRRWGWMEAGGIGFVYVGAATRISFLSGIGVVEVGKDRKA